MNLSKLFEMQKVLDERIILEKGLEGQDLLPNKILALQVELGEMANEWRGFKHWSSDRKPRTEKLLEEYVDCLHFILSIGLSLGQQTNDLILPREDLVPAGKVDMVRAISEMITFDWRKDADEYGQFFTVFVYLGELFGFAWEQIEQAYFAKNAINHERQSTGY